MLSAGDDRVKRQGDIHARRRLGAVALVVTMLAAIAAYLVASRLEDAAYPEIRGEMSAHFGTLPTAEFQGRTYQLKPNLTTLLLIGFDKADDSAQTGYRQGGQADFLLLMVLDHKNRTVHQLHIERDTITNVVVLGLTGKEVGTRRMQICLSHGFGATPESNCVYTLRAVGNLLQGTEIDLYYAVDMRAIDRLNDALGGVTVPIEDDFSAFDPAMVQGTTMTLQGKQAELYVRSRREIGDGTNESRMRRQQCFMSAASEQMRRRMAEDASFADTLLDALEGISHTNMSRGRIINELNRAYQYNILPVETLAGEYILGSDGFMEFHADEEAIAEWIIKVFYNPMVS